MISKVNVVTSFQLADVLATVGNEFYKCLRTIVPNPSPRNVAMEIPKMPARIPGTIREPHPFVVAIPQAVVGPPILAFDAMSNSFKSKRKSFPNPRIMARWTVT